MEQLESASIHKRYIGSTGDNLMMIIQYDSPTNIISASMVMKILPPAGRVQDELVAMISILLRNTVPEHDWNESGKIWIVRSYGDLSLAGRHDKRDLIVGHKRVMIAWWPSFEFWSVIVTHKDNNEFIGF